MPSAVQRSHWTSCPRILTSGRQRPQRLSQQVISTTKKFRFLTIWHFIFSSSYIKQANIDFTPATFQISP
ncbi:hypothetical protein VULLAG_LOCUS17848 [Vulpes lagopus]